jgi:hypothetical protein
MIAKLAAASLVALSFGTPAFPHRLDEYLQATKISLEKDRIRAEIRLTPGIAVLPVVMAIVDTDVDGIASPSEQRAYAERVLRDLSLSINGSPLKLELLSATFPEPDALKEGLGEIKLDLAAAVPRPAAEHKLIFENRHQQSIAAYLVNCLTPSDPDLQVTAQRRNYEQSHYELEYSQRGVPTSSSSLPSWLGGPVWLVLVAAVVLLARLAVSRRPKRA